MAWCGTPPVIEPAEERFSAYVRRLEQFCCRERFNCSRRQEDGACSGRQATYRASHSSGVGHVRAAGGPGSPGWNSRGDLRQDRRSADQPLRTRGNGDSVTTPISHMQPAGG